MPPPRKKGYERAREIGARIADRRAIVGLRQSELAKKIGISQNQISLYERGTSRIDVAIIERIAAVLGVNPGELCGWCDD